MVLSEFACWLHFLLSFLGRPLFAREEGGREREREREILGCALAA